MYPRVRVRALEGQVSRQEEAAPCHGSSGNINLNKYAAIACTNSKDSPYILKDNRNNIRASSVPPPRAVLSSPDNDGIIGNRNKRIQERGRPAKKQAADSNGMTDRYSPLTRETKVPSTQSLYIRMKAKSGHWDQRAVRQPFNLNNHNPPEPDDGDVKVEKQPLKTYMHTPPKANHSDDARIESSSNKKSVSRKAGAGNSYPKIKVFGAVDIKH